MNQTWKDDEKPNFVPSFGLLGSNLDPKTFFCEFYLHYFLNIIPSYYSMQLKEELMNRICENGEKPSFEPNFWRFGSNLSPLTFFCDFCLYY